MSEYNIDHC